MNLIATLQRLGVPRGGILYVHSSMNWLERVGLGPAEVMEALAQAVTEKTTVSARLLAWER